MAIRIGSARMDENGKAHGGAAGDQTGREVSAQSWYLHRSGWRVFRAKDSEKAARIAEAMRAACANSAIGYDQYQRDSLYRQAEKVGFDIAKVVEKCETDCSALVRVCCAYAGIPMDSFRTANQPKALLNTGAFVELKGARYAEQSRYLGAGDILCTPVQGHTAVVLENGPKYEGSVEAREYAPGERILRNGDSGQDVKQLQAHLLALGFDLGKWGADGDYGDCTELAVMEFQRGQGLEADGEYGPLSHGAMLKALEKADGEGEAVRIEGGQCWVRDEDNAGGGKLGVAKRNSRWPYAGERSAGGWLKIVYGDGCGWVSGKYGRLV